MKRPARRSSASKLTEDNRRLILGAIERGATEAAAAGAVGIAPRTFRELRQRALGEHPTRSALPKLAAFFQQVDQASSRVRAKIEIVIADTDPKHWLKYQARSKPGSDGWSEPVPELAESAALYVPNIEELEQVVAELLTSGAVSGPPCPDPECPCAFHRAERSKDAS